MKHFLKASTLAAACMTAAVAAQAQTAAEIVKKHNEAIGGTANWAKVTSMKKTGTMTVMGMDMPVTISILKNKGMRQDFSVMGSDCYVIMTPTAGWTYIPPQGHTKPEPMPAEQLSAATASEYDFQDPLTQAAASGQSIEMVGKEDVGGASCFKLKVKNADGKEAFYLVDAKTYYTVQQQATAEAAGQQVEVTRKFSDFKKLPEGIVVAMKEDAGDAGAMTYSAVELNTIADETIFKP